MSDNQNSYDLDTIGGLIEQAARVLSASPETADAVAQIAQAAALTHMAKSLSEIAGAVGKKNGKPVINVRDISRGG